MAQLSVNDGPTDCSALAPDARPPSLVESRKFCRETARAHYENFTVASWLLPRRLLPHFYAVYAFCRGADDLADESGDAGERLAALDAWQDELDACYSGSPRHPLFVALRATVDEFSLPKDPFLQLLAAFRQDQRVTRYATHEDVLGYCRNSANPVGHLVLYLGRCHDLRRAALSDSICTGLQLANFCQDVARDFAKGRIYLPLATLESAGCSERELASWTASAGLRRALRWEVDRAEMYLREGQPLVDLMPRELRVDVSLFIEGGLSILSAIRRSNYDVLLRRPTVSRWTQLRLLFRCWLRARRLWCQETEP